MHARIRTEPILAVLAFACLAGMMVWYLGEVTSPIRPIVPGCSDLQVATLNLPQPAAIAWESCYVNEDNPFVPWTQRSAQPRAPVAPRPAPEPQPGPAGPTPVVRFPLRPEGGGHSPRLLGFQDQAGAIATVVVLMPGESRPRQMKPGEAVGGWTFVGIEAGNIATFTDHHGRTLARVVGD